MHRYIAALAALGALVAGPRTETADDAPDAAQIVEIEIRGFRFHADTVRVPAGATVRWTNRDQVKHTSTAEAGAWESPLLGTGESFSVKFEEPGTFPYYCNPHPFMRGVLVVEGDGLNS